MRPEGKRDSIIGSNGGPEAPFPLRLDGKVIKGFGRGSKELGIPTANIPVDGLTVGGQKDVESGIYFGWAGLSSQSAAQSPAQTASSQKFSDERNKVYPMVMSIGWNPFYKNEKRSVEVHIMHTFEEDFYDSHMNLCILGFIRPEYDYVSKEALVEDIMTDIEVARKSLARPAYERYKAEGYLLQFANRGDVAT